MDKYDHIIKEMISFAIICMSIVLASYFFREVFDMKKLSETGKHILLGYIIINILINSIAILALWNITPDFISKLIYDKKDYNTKNYYLILSDGSVIISADCKRIIPAHFSENHEIKSVRFMSDDTEISEKAFFNCKNLNFINLPCKLKTIEKFSFSFCRGLISITIPEEVTEIKNHAFSGCENLEKICFKCKGNISIEEDAFLFCSKLKRIEITNASCTLKKDVFPNKAKIIEVFATDGEKNSTSHTL